MEDEEKEISGTLQPVKVIIRNDYSEFTKVVSTRKSRDNKYEYEFVEITR